MKLHRYYVERDLPHNFWLDDKALFHQWTRVLRYAVGRQVVLFNAEREVRLYRIVKFGNDAAHLELITEMKQNLPRRDVYLCFAMLKKDKMEWVLQKGTELGVSHFVPLITDRTEKTGWNQERARKITIEATEQCERADVPRLRQPLSPRKLIEELHDGIDILIAEAGDPLNSHKSILESSNPIAILVGPEGGWSDEEKGYFAANKLPHFSLSRFTLRAETAAISAAALLQ